MRLPDLRLTAALLPAVAVLLAGACARQGQPPGGEPDQRPPVVVSVTPDTFARVEPGSDQIRIRFNERISERSASGALDAAVRVSPRTGRVRVNHKRDGLDVTLEGGFRPGLVYRVRLEPVVQDLFNNTMRAPFEWVFSTGADFEDNAVGGLVWDRLTGEPVEQVQVLLRAGAPDQPGFDTLPAYAAWTDTAGIFALRYLPTGWYHITAFRDQNVNDEPDAFEQQGTHPIVELGEADTLITQLAIMVPDTSPPQLVRVAAVDSLTLRVETDDHLDPDASLGDAVSGIEAEEGSAPAIAEILPAYRWEAYQDSVRAVADSLAAAARADSLARDPDAITDPMEVADTAEVADAVEVADPSERIDPRGLADTLGAGAPADTTDLEGADESDGFLPDGRRVPERRFFVRLADPLAPDVPYVLRVRALVNVSGLTSEDQEMEFTWQPPQPPPDTETPADTGAAADTAVADTGVVADPTASDTGAVADTGGARRPPARLSKAASTQAPPPLAAAPAAARVARTEWWWRRWRGPGAP